MLIKVSWNDALVAMMQNVICKEIHGAKVMNDDIIAYFCGKIPIVLPSMDVVCMTVLQC